LNVKITKSFYSQLKRSFVRVLESKATFIFAALIFKLTIEFSYLVFVSPLYSYMGFVWSPNFVKWTESWVLFFIVVGIIPSKLSKPSHFLLLILLFNIVIPLLSFYGLANKSRYHLYIVLFGYGLIYIFRRGRLLRIPLLKEGPQISEILILLGCIGVSLWFVYSGGTQYFQIDLTKVYDYRRLSAELIKTGPMGYINTWAYFVFGPGLLTIALWRKKYSIATLAFLLHIFWFGVSAQKFVLFAPFPVLFVWLIFRKTRSPSWVPLGLTVIVSGVLFISLTFNYPYPASMFVRRLFFVIANNTFDYYQFFSDNPWVWWSNSSVTLGLIEYPYDLIPAKLIGEWQGNESHVNNTFLSTGYMHAGIVGIALYGILVGFLFRLIDSFAARGLPVWVVLGILIMPCYSLIISSDFPTALLTKGVGIGLVLVFLMRSA
jgi:hypothetical protein